MSSSIPFHASFGYTAHLFKALTKQHHREMLPLFKKYISKDGVVFDVGAHSGQFTKLLSKMVPQGQVYSFEPGAYQLSILRKVILVHGLKNVSLFPCGLSDKVETSKLHMPIKKSGSFGFGLAHIGTPNDARQTRVETIALNTIDNFVQEQNIQRLDFIKADIEGWELRMLHGARKTLETFRPTLILEVDDHYLERAGDSTKDVRLFLESCRYDAFKLAVDGALVPVGEAWGDVLCLPRL